MNIVVTDSGFGGLGIAARLYESLKSHNSTETIDIIFVNGLPYEKYGYNSFLDEKLKINVFNNLLVNINQKIKPDLIVIACNTLSVLFNKTKIYSEIKSKVIDIIEFGTEKVIQIHKSESNALLAILGTKTTIYSEVHRSYFQKYPCIFSDVLAIPCTELVTAIEDDFESMETKSIIKSCVNKIGMKFVDSNYSKLFLILACTHFPYVEHIFRHYLDKLDISYTLINPNYFMIKSIENIFRDRLKTVPNVPGKIKISIISKTVITNQKIESISMLIKNISEDTITALHDYRHIPDFFLTEIGSNILNRSNIPSN